jgi:hypothetical protein
MAKNFVYLLLFVFFTMLTQIGGMILVFSIWGYRVAIKRRIQHRKHHFLYKIACFTGLYLFATIAIVPVLAKQFGRVPMPVFGNDLVQPVNLWTCILNRHYVRPALRKTIENTAIQLNEIHKGTEIRYLEANMPFYNGFPLVPHLSHNDGRKLDLSFFYTDKKTGKPTNEKPSFYGYGVYAGPRPGEEDRIEYCKAKGYWQYDFSKYLTFGSNESRYELDETRTKMMIELLVKTENIEKMFIEPHLEKRMGLTSYNKVRLHGCQAVRHDDHLHIQVR